MIILSKKKRTKKQKKEYHLYDQINLHAQMKDNRIIYYLIWVKFESDFGNLYTFIIKTVS